MIFDAPVTLEMFLPQGFAPRAGKTVSDLCLRGGGVEELRGGVDEDGRLRMWWWGRRSGLTAYQGRRQSTLDKFMELK